MKYFLWLTCFLASIYAYSAALKITQLPVLTNSQSASSDVTAVVDVSADITKQFSLGEFDLRYHSANVVSGTNEGYWILKNAYYDEGTDKFNRSDVSATAYAINLKNQDIDGTSESGLAIWKASPGTNPISSTYGISGGWQPLLTVLETGAATLNASPTSGDNSKKIATTEFINYKRSAVVSISASSGSRTVDYQYDGMLNDTVASAVASGTGITFITLKTNQFSPPGTSNPIVLCNVWGNSTPNVCQVDSPLTTNPYTFIVTTKDATTGISNNLNVRLFIMGSGN